MQISEAVVRTTDPVTERDRSSKLEVLCKMKCDGKIAQCTILHQSLENSWVSRFKRARSSAREHAIGVVDGNVCLLKTNCAAQWHKRKHQCSCDSQPRQQSPFFSARLTLFARLWAISFSYQRSIVTSSFQLRESTEMRFTAKVIS